MLASVGEAAAAQAKDPLHAGTREWLNMAEVEPAVLSRRCLCRRIGEQSVLKGEVAMRAGKRNLVQTTDVWRFRTADARILLRHLYPSVLARRPTSLRLPKPAVCLERRRCATVRA